MTDHMAPPTVVAVPRNDGMNQRKVVPNRRSAPAATVLNRDIPFSFPLDGARLQPPAWAQTKRGDKDPVPTGRSDPGGLLPGGLVMLPGPGTINPDGVVGLHRDAPAGTGSPGRRRRR